MSSFGQELKRERRLREISLQEVAEATKIQPRHLEALERNDFAKLPGGVFNRGYVRAYCQHIGVDPEAMVNAYLLEEQEQSSTVPGIGKLLRGPRAGSRKPPPSGPARAIPGPEPWKLPDWALVAIALAFILACLLLYLRLAGGDPDRSGPEPSADAGQGRVHCIERSQSVFRHGRG